MTKKEVLIIVLSGEPDAADIDRIRDAVRVASGYSVVMADELAARREHLSDEKKLKELVSSGLNRVRPLLSDEEHGVLTRFLDGDRNRAIAKALKLPVHRVSSALTTVQRKLGVDNRVDLIRAVVTPTLNAH